MTAHGQLDNISREKLEELCSDPMWRLENLYWVRDKEGKAVPFKLWDEQRKFLENIWYRNIIPKARQRGFSTVVQLMMLDSCIFNDNQAAAIIAQDKITAGKIFRDKIMFAYERLPDAIKLGNPLTKKTETEYNWSNESSLYVSASARGSTLQLLHVSELGTVAKRFPAKVHEIIAGALAAVDINGIIIIESTVESADDKFSEMVKEAQKLEQSGADLHRQQYRLHFASWWDADEYEADPRGVAISKTDKAYFDRLEGILKIKIGPRKRARYVLKRDSDYSGDDAMMHSQYPSTLEEALSVATEGKWLAKQMAQVRTDNRILQIPIRRDVPAITAWDIGTNDDTCVWVGQEIDLYVNWIRFIEASGEPYSHFVTELDKMGLVWAYHLVPHDADHRTPGKFELKTSRDMLEDLGLRKIHTVPRIPEYQTGVDQMRAAFPRYRFDEENCKEGIEHLDKYSKVWDQTHGRYTSVYAKNGHQHCADALRQHGQYAHNLSINPEGRGRPKRKNRSGRVA